MTNRADQNWPEGMTYELTVCDSSTDDNLLGSDHSVRTVVESAEECQAIPAIRRTGKSYTS